MKFLNIQAARGIAALLVLTAHLAGLGLTTPNVAGFSFPHGVVGVDIFFVLSGFIMAYTTQKNWGSVGAFLGRRVWRIFPLYWGCTLLAVGLLPWIYAKAADMGPADLAAGLVLLPGSQPLISLAWTLIYEMYFYLIMAGLMLFPRAHITLRVTGVFAAIGIASTMILPDGVLKAQLTNTIVLEFALGTLLFECWNAQWLRLRWLIPAFAASSVIAMFAYPDGQWRFLTFGGFAWLGLAIALRAEAKGIVAPQWLVFVGTASYAIYLTHMIALERLMGYPMAYGLHPIAGFLAMALGAVALGVAVHLIIERPLLGVRSIIRAPA